MITTKPTTDQQIVHVKGRSLPIKIFLVEDDMYFNKVIERYLMKIGIENHFKVEVESFFTGQECIDSLGHNPDLVILDFYLDSNNDITCTGYDVLQKIKQAKPDALVIIISQQHEWESFKKEFIEFGAFDFLKKDDDLYDNLETLIRDNFEFT